MEVFRFPLRLLLLRPGAVLATLASALWGTNTVLGKLAIDHMTPSSGPVVALLGTFLMVVLLTPGALWTRSREGTQKHRWKGLAAHPRALSLAILIPGIPPPFVSTPIALRLFQYFPPL